MVSSRAQILTFLLIDQLFSDVSTTNSVGVLIAHMLLVYIFLIIIIIIIAIFLLASSSSHHQLHKTASNMIHL